MTHSAPASNPDNPSGERPQGSSREGSNRYGNHRPHGGGGRLGPCGWAFRERFRYGFGSRFGEGVPARHHGRHGGANHPPVDIEDTRDAFVLSLFASGLDKQRIHVGVRNDLLTIRYTSPAAGDEPARRFTRRESWSADFVREFALNGKVLVDAMSASYADGVLTVRLPKTPEAMQPEHTVVIG